MLTWVPGEVALDSVLGPPEVLNELLLLQRRQQSAGAAGSGGVAQQPVRGPAKGLSGLEAVRRDGALVAEGEPKSGHRGGAGRCPLVGFLLRALVHREGGSREHTRVGAREPREVAVQGCACDWSSTGGARSRRVWLCMKASVRLHVSVCVCTRVFAHISMQTG